MFFMLLASIVSASNHTKCVLLSKPKCMTHPALIKLHPKSYIQELRNYPFVVNLNRCVEVVKLWTTNLIDYVFQMKRKI